MSDGEIIALFFARDEQAIVETKRKYGSLCFRIALGILGDARDAEECVSDALLKLWQSIPPETPRSLRSYLCGILKNGSVNRLRDNRRNKRSAGAGPIALEELEECLPAPGGVEESFETAELAGVIDRWLAFLKREERVLFIKRYWFEESVEEAASNLGVSSTAAVKRLARLRKKLRAHIEKEIYDNE